MPGKTIGKYKILSKLSWDTHLAEHTETNERVSVRKYKIPSEPSLEKVANSSAVPLSEAEQKEQQRVMHQKAVQSSLPEEAKISLDVHRALRRGSWRVPSGKVSHENVETLKEVLRTEHHLYFITNFTPSNELFDMIVQKRHLDEDTARQYFAQLMHGLAFCHTQGVAHRDIKPENLMVSFPSADKEGADGGTTVGTLRITCWGLASIGDKGSFTDEQLLSDSMVGTPNYVAPEVLTVTSSRSSYNPFAADVWSCGVTLYAMLGGRLPFDSINMQDLFRAIEKGTFIPLKTDADGVSKEVIDLIDKMLVVDPKKRITVSGILAHPWIASCASFHRKVPPKRFFAQHDTVWSWENHQHFTESLRLGVLCVHELLYYTDKGGEQQRIPSEVAHVICTFL